MIAPSFSEAMQQGWTGQEWQMACQQEDIERENAEDEEDDDGDDGVELDGNQQYMPGWHDSNVVCTCPACQRSQS